jgi:hypothetical protein
MRYLIFGLILSLGFIACKNEPTIKKATYPAFWSENNIPTFEDGIITNTSEKIENIKVAQTAFVQTERSFDEIHKWHLDEFKANGWKNVKNIRKNIGQDDEHMILVHTQGKLKHSITVLKNSMETQQIKTVVAKFNG